MGYGYQSSEKILREICPESKTASPKVGMAVLFSDCFYYGTKGRKDVQNARSFLRFRISGLENILRFAS
jgi:hypothetical protein